MQSFIATTLVWIVAQLGYGGALPPPRVQIVAPAQLMEIAAAGDPSIQDFIDQHNANLGGLYIPGSGTIYLPQDFNFHAFDDKVTLVHEMVHYAQDRLGIRGPASGLESQAYEIQYRWRDGNQGANRTGTANDTISTGGSGTRQVHTFGNR